MTDEFWDKPTQAAERERIIGIIQSVMYSSSLQDDPEQFMLDLIETIRSGVSAP